VTRQALPLVNIWPQDCPDAAVRLEATLLLNEIHPVMLRFMADEYDDTSSTIFPLLQTILSSVRNIIFIS
jgi:exportin-T